MLLLAKLNVTFINKKAMLSQRCPRDAPHINRPEKISVGIIFLARNFDDQTVIIIPKLFLWMVGERLDAGITFIVFVAVMPTPRGTPANICIYHIFLQTRTIGLHFAADSMGLSSLQLWWIRKTFIFLQE